jgi:hypothetical protein
MRSCLFTVSLLVLTCALASRPTLWAQNPKDQITDVEKAGPDFLVQGEYEGMIAGKDKLGAQVIAKGDGKFAGFFLIGGLPGAGFDSKTRVKLDAKTADGKTAVTGTTKNSDGKTETWSGTIADGKLTGKTADGQEFSLKRIVRQSPTLGAKPPSGAIVLFDGTSADEWSPGKLVEGNLLQMGTNSKRKFTDLKLHVEFRCPYQPFAGGQGRGNSGVYMQGKYEVQVLDSFGLDAKADDCAAMYGLRKPDVNMSFPPLSWQTYDIEYRVPRYDGDKKKTGATITVLHNGVKVHDNYEIKGSGDKPGEDKPGVIHLQNHGNPVYFRNIWVVEKK